MRTKLEILREAVALLETVPDKFRISFDPYWWWYQKTYQPGLEKLRKELEEEVGNQPANRAN